MATQNKSLPQICADLSKKYSVCDISDALLKLKIPHAGHLPDITPIPGLLTPQNPPRHIIAPITTVLFTSKTHPLPPSTPASNIPSTTHWTDLPTPGNLVLLSQPRGQICAVAGDIMATRLKIRGTRGIIADGRVRDISAMRELSHPERNLCGEQAFTVWSRGTSTVGTGLEAQAWAVDVPVRIGGGEGVLVHPGDIVCADEAENGVAVIPRERFEEVVAMLAALKEVDERCVADVQAGVDVGEAFRRHR
ncbi:DlpA domain-containing protein [Teratosphaeria nubilosa]|uniref:DlpA domain-containing protein n=1 Tax=Teratosphaeria nubilosa TaxID=161662 RepID=A0A6G1LDA5_9PEZI|nr:DlpA domain-containing protein [Teratosphaeria nubilosa]